MASYDLLVKGGALVNTTKEEMLLVEMQRDETAAEVQGPYGQAGSA